MTKITPTLISAGAMGGLLYGIYKQKSFWTTAGFTLLFAFGGAALGTTYEAIKS